MPSGEFGIGRVPERQCGMRHRRGIGALKYCRETGIQLGINIAIPYRVESNRTEP
jgi:hypothetical protein